MTVLKKFINRYSGFTLVELLVVVGILGILAAALLMTLDPFSQVQKGNDAKRKSDLSQIQKALETYYQDKGKYPINQSTTYKIYDERIINNSIVGIVDWGTSWTPYINLLPKDPSYNYVYVSTNNGQGYRLYARLERGSKDPQACPGTKCSNAPSNACGSGIQCNYGVTSPDETL